MRVNTKGKHKLPENQSDDDILPKYMDLEHNISLCCLSSNYKAEFVLRMEKLEENKKEKENTERILSQLREEISKSKTKIGSLETEIGSLKTELNSFKTELNSLKTEIDRLKTELNLLRDERMNIHDTDGIQGQKVQPEVKEDASAPGNKPDASAPGTPALQPDLAYQKGEQYEAKGDKKTALRYYESSGYVPAYSRIAALYERDKAYKKAWEWYIKAAQAGDSEGEYHLGCFYDKGFYVYKNSYRAMKYYEKAAAKGHPEAIRRLEASKAASGFAWAKKT
jgi:regulator of replication initiation timing